MNTVQTIFTIFYGMYFAAIVSLTGPLVPFDTPSMFKWQWKAWLRFIISFLFINVAPLGYFLLVYRWLEPLKSVEITFLNLFVLLLLSLGGFAFYRIYWGLMLLRINNKLLFYQDDLPKDLTEKIKNHPSGKAAGEVLPNLIPGVVWILLTIVIGRLYNWSVK